MGRSAYMVERLDAPPPGVSWALWNANRELHKRRAGLPGASVVAPVASEGATEDNQLPASNEPSPVAAPCPKARGTVTVFNEVLIAILQAKEVATGRVWLVARGTDAEGCGRVPVADLYEALPKLTTRRVRQVLQAGEGKYWYVGRAHLYLISQEKVAARLGVGRIRRDAVAVTVAKMAQSVKAAKAVMWNAVHCGRKSAHPISRVTLSGMGVKDPRTQRSLEQMEGIRSAQQYAVIGSNNPYDRRQAEENEEPVFTLQDHKGVMGKRGRVYLARHLPNIYTGTLQTVAHGKKWFNRQLRKLHDKGSGAKTRPQIERVFFADGKRAGRAWDKQPLTDTYWPANKRQAARAWWTMRGVSQIERAEWEENKRK